MRLGSLTLSATLSAALLSGCSFVGGQSTNNGNSYAKQYAAHASQYGNQRYGQHADARNCQVATQRQYAPRGCGPEQVTRGPSAQNNHQGHNRGYGAQGGFAQQPQFGQPQYADSGFGSAVGQTSAVAHHTSEAKKRKPKLRGSLSIGIDQSVDGELLKNGSRDEINPIFHYDPQAFNESFVRGAQSSGNVTTTTYTANELGASNIFAPNSFESATTREQSFNDIWSTPIGIKAGLEYILNDKTTVFANGGYTYSEGNTVDVSTVSATVYEQVISQDYTQEVNAAGEDVPGSFRTDGPPETNVTFLPNQQIATFAYDFSNLERYDLEVGARRYFNPIVKSDGFRTVTPFVGASVGATYVNAVDVTVAQTQTSFQTAFNGGVSGEAFDVPTADTPTRLYNSQWLPQAQLNVGAEWQVTPGFAIAAETGVRVQDGRDFANFTNAAGENVSGGKGDTNISIPVTLRGSINF